MQQDLTPDPEWKKSLDRLLEEHGADSSEVVDFLASIKDPRALEEVEKFKAEDRFLESLAKDTELLGRLNERLEKI